MNDGSDLFESDPTELQAFIEEGEAEAAEEKTNLDETNTGASRTRLPERLQNQDLEVCGSKIPMPLNYRSLARYGRVICAKVSDPQKRHAFIMDLAFPYMIRLSPSFHALFYLASKDLYPEEFAQLERPRIKDILKLFSADEIIGILVTVYTYSQIKKRCPKEEWTNIAPRVHTHIALGFLVGTALKEFDRGFALYAASLRPLAMALIAHTEGKSYSKYQKQMAREGMIFDLQQEFELWGFTHHDVAAYLCQKIGFGLAAANGLAADSPNVIGLSDEEKVWTTTRDIVSRIYVREVDGSALAETGLKVDLEAVSTLTNSIPEIMDKAEENFSWLIARKTSIDEVILGSLKRP